MTTHRDHTWPVTVGGIQLGGGAPIRVQSMTDTETANISATARQILELAQAGAEIVRFTVDTHEAAHAVPFIRDQVREAGCEAALAGDFHFNGHVLLARHPDCAKALDKYRINPGNAGAGAAYDENFGAFCRIAAELGKPVRIGVNTGSLNTDLIERKLRENRASGIDQDRETVLNACMILSALESTELAIQHGLLPTQIVLSVKSSSPKDMVNLYRTLSEQSRQPLHVGLTEAGMGIKGIVWSTAAMTQVLMEGIGDTIRVSLTPSPNGNRCEEVTTACELLQALGLRRFAPSITSCPGCGRTHGVLYRELAARTRAFLDAHAAQWRKECPGSECLSIAVMGCVVNGPGESKSAHIGLCLPGKAEGQTALLYEDGVLVNRFQGDADAISVQFQESIASYITRNYSR